MYPGRCGGCLQFVPSFKTLADKLEDDFGIEVPLTTPLILHLVKF